MDLFISYLVIFITLFFVILGFIYLFRLIKKGGQFLINKIKEKKKKKGD